MKLTCSISGVTVTASSSFGRLWKEYSTKHPVFQLPAPRLWKLAHSQASTPEQWKKLTAEEQKLLFLALLNESGLLHWNCAASPSASLINSLFPRVYQFCAWKSALRAPRKFPHFSVSVLTADMRSLPAWLEECEEIRADEFTALTLREKQKVQSEVDERLSILQRRSVQSAGALSRYRNKLADWAIAEAEVPNTYVSTEGGRARKQALSLRDLVRQILVCPNEEIFTVNESDLSYLSDYFSLNLPLGSLASFAVHERLRELQGLKQSELSDFEMLFEIPERTVAGTASEARAVAEQSANSTANSQTEQQQTSNPGNTVAQTDKPQRHQFKSDFLFQLALARHSLGAA